MTHKKTEVAKKLKSLPDLLGAINAYYDCSTGLDITHDNRHQNHTSKHLSSDGSNIAALEATF